MKKWVFVLIIMAFALFMPVSAEIFLSQPAGSYNVGDEVRVDIVLSPSVDVNDFLVVDIVCSGKVFNIYKNSFNLDAGEREVASISFLLSNSLGLVGESSCLIKAHFSGEYIESQKFSVTRGVSVGLESPTKRVFDLGESMIVRGNAVKHNGQPVRGVVEVTLEPMNLSAGGVVTDGNFLVNFTIPKDYAGNQDVRVRVYEKDSNGEVTNSGETSRAIEIRSTLTAIEISLDSDEIEPGSNFTYMVNLLDQAGQVMSGDVEVNLYAPDGSRAGQDLRESGKEIKWPVMLNFMPGYWKIEAIAGNINKQEFVNIEEKKSLDFNLVNSTLLISNIGNVKFFGPVEITIGSSTKVRQIELEIGESKRFKLSAPQGDYTIEIKDGDNELKLGTVFLTGRAVDVGEIRGGMAGLVTNGFLWLFFLVIAFLFLMVFTFKKKVIGVRPFSSINQKKLNSASSVGSSPLISGGRKYESGIVALRIKPELDDVGFKALQSAITKAKELKGGLSIDGDHHVLVFTPLLTKNKDNARIALQAAKEIDSILKEYNQKHASQIDYGIGVNSGEIIAEFVQGKMRFVSVGNVTNLAKRISNESRQEVLVSDDLHRKLISDAKFEKIQGKQGWKLDSLVNREKHESFIGEFMKGFDKTNKPGSSFSKFPGV